LNGGFVASNFAAGSSAFGPAGANHAQGGEMAPSTNIETPSCLQ
jgi:hypothetical protein